MSSPITITTTQPPTLDALHQVLHDELQQAERTREALRRKQEALLTNQPKTLPDIDRELLALARKAKQLEGQRFELMRGLGHPDQTLEQLIQHLPPPESRRFTQMRDQLRRALLDVAHLNQENRTLLDLSIRWVRETVELIANALTPEGASYTAQGAKNRPDGSGAAPSSLAQSTINHQA